MISLKTIGCIVGDEEEQFQGAGGPENLIDIIKIFISWNDKLCLAKNAFSTRSENVLHWLQKWYKSQCDGDWEHEFGIKIDTLDNPGWVVVIDVKETDCENKLFIEIDQQTSENNWIQCNIKDGKFLGYGGPQNLIDIIKIFMDWKNS